jgi:hypothetical protein
VEVAYEALPARLRGQASVFTANYGEASALVLYAGSRLPPVLSGHNTYWLWGPGRAPDGAVIAVGAVPALRPYFRVCTTTAVVRPPHDVVNDENGVVIATCTGPTAPWPSLWGRLKHYD